METNIAGEKVKKERNDKIFFKHYVFTHFSVCSFANLHGRRQHRPGCRPVEKVRMVDVDQEKSGWSTVDIDD